VGLIKTAIVSSVVVAVGLQYWVLPAVDRATPWDGALPSSCGAAPEVRAAGWTGLANDVGLLLHRVAEGPPTGAEMVALASSAGSGTAAVHHALDEGTSGRQLLPLAPSSPSAPEDVVARALLAAGATPAEAVTLTAIAGPESGYNLTAANPTSSAAGPWQMLNVHGLSVAERQNPAVAAQKALSLAREPNGVARHWAETLEASQAYEARAAAAVARASAPVCPPGAPGVYQAGLGTGAAPVGWQAMEAALRQRFPDVRITSTVRPGAITSSGRRSYHADGLAVDIEPRMEIFNWIAETYGASTTELIFSPAGSRQIHRGQPYTYEGRVVSDHYDHIHWAVAGAKQAG